MKKKRKAVIFPFDQESVPLVRYAKLLDDFDIIGGVSPNSWGVVGKDPGVLYGGGATGIYICDKFSGIQTDFDSVILTSPMSSAYNNQIILSEIMNGITQGKDIINTITFSQQDQKTIMEYCLENDINFKNYTHGRLTIDIKPANDELLKINTPIIMILGTAEKTQKFEVQLSIRESVISKGYKVSQVGSRNYCELFGFHSFPEFMFGSGIEETKKVIMFNRYIKEIENSEKPDLIIIGVPGGIMPINKTFTNKFGILAMEIGSAVSPDMIVLSSFLLDMEPSGLAMLSTLCKYRFACEVSCFTIANTQLDWSDSKYSKKLSYLTLDYKYVEKKIQDMGDIGIPLYTVLHPTHASRMADLLIGNLTEYGAVQSL